MGYMNTNLKTVKEIDQRLDLLQTKQIYLFTLWMDFQHIISIIEKFGKCRTSVGCLRINKLSDVNLEILEELVKDSYESMKKKYK